MEQLKIPDLELKILQVLWNNNNRISVQDVIHLFLGNKLDMVGAFFADTGMTKEELSQIKKMINKWEVKDD